MLTVWKITEETTRKRLPVHEDVQDYYWNLKTRAKTRMTDG